MRIACALARRLTARSDRSEIEKRARHAELTVETGTERDCRLGEATGLSSQTADRRPIPATISKTWMVEPCRETALLPALLVSRQGDRWINRLARHLDKANSLAARRSLGVARVGSRTITELGR